MASKKNTSTTAVEAQIPEKTVEGATEAKKGRMASNKANTTKSASDESLPVRTKKESPASSKKSSPASSRKKSKKKSRKPSAKPERMVIALMKDQHTDAKNAFTCYQALTRSKVSFGTFMYEMAMAGFKTTNPKAYELAEHMKEAIAAATEE